MAENKLTRMAKIASANPKSWGIVDAIEISGHRSVSTVTDLYALAGCILSSSFAGEAASGIAHTGADAIGLIWYVQDTAKYYKLKSWSDTLSADNWEEVYIGANSGKVDDVLVNGASVVSNKIANIDLSEYAKTSEVITELQGDKAVKVEGNKISLNVASSHGLINSDSGLELILNLEYDSANKKIKLTGESGNEISSIDATNFIKDGMLDSATYNEDDHSLTLTFNTEAGKDPISVDLSALIPTTYDGSNVKLTSATLPETYSAPAVGDSVNDAFAKLVKKINDQENTIDNLWNKLIAGANISIDKTDDTVTISANTSVNPEDATETNNSLITSLLVKNYIENTALAWTEL